MPIFAHISDSMLAATSASTTAVSPIPTLSALSPIAVNLLVGAFLIICVVMILIVLIQRPQGGGLSGAFGAGGGGGSSGAGQTAFGTKTGDVLTWATIGIFVAFLLFAIGLNFVTRPDRTDPTETIISAPAGTPVESIGDPENADTENPDADGVETVEDAIEDAGTDTSVEEVIDDVQEDITNESPETPADES
mgnify:FL=1